MKEAQKYGCTLFLGVTVDRITRDGGRFDEVAITHRAEKIVIKPEIIIAADGRNSIFHRYSDKQSLNKEWVAYGVTGSHFIQPDTSEIYFDADLAPGGYFYTVTSLTGLSSAGIVVDAEKMKGSSEEYFYDFLSKKPAIADKITTRANTFRGEGHLFTLNRHTQHNLLLIGDAAGLTDPLMGYGMMPAIVSGYYAGRYSVEARKKKNYELLRNYQRTVRRRLNKRVSHAFSRIFEALDNRDLDTLITMANDLEARTDVDDLITQFSISGLYHVVNVFLKKLPDSGRLLKKGIAGICLLKRGNSPA